MTRLQIRFLRPKIWSKSPVYFKRLLLCLLLLSAPQWCNAEIVPVVSVVDGADLNGGTSDAINTTGVNLLVAGIVRYSGGGSGTVAFSDSKGNTWTPLTEQTRSDISARLYYCLNPIVGTGHTFTTAGTIIQTGIVVQGFSGVAAFDQQTANIAGGTSIQPGSLTPPSGNCLFVSFCVAYDTANTISVNSSFTKVGETHNAWGFTGAYKIQTSAGAENPTYSWSGNEDCIALMATFTAADDSVVVRRPNLSGNFQTLNGNMQ